MEYALAAIALCLFWRLAVLNERALGPRGFWFDCPGHYDMKRDYFGKDEKMRAYDGTCPDCGASVPGLDDLADGLWSCSCGTLHHARGAAHIYWHEGAEIELRGERRVRAACEAQGINTACIPGFRHEPRRLD